MRCNKFTGSSFLLKADQDQTEMLSTQVNSERPIFAFELVFFFYTFELQINLDSPGQTSQGHKMLQGFQINITTTRKTTDMTVTFNSPQTNMLT